MRGENKTKLLYILGALLIGAGAVILLFVFLTNVEEEELFEEEPQEVPEEGDKDVISDEVSWQTYENSVYSFSIQYPQGWEFAEDTHSDYPRFSFYDPESVPEDYPPAPFDHFAPVAHVSVYPHGIPTEAVFGEREETDVPAEVRIDYSQSYDYVLEDGTEWATMLRFIDMPVNWTESGYIWAAVTTENVEEKCILEGERVPMSQCDVFVGMGELVREGSVNETTRALEEEMIASFRFTE